MNPLGKTFEIQLTSTKSIRIFISHSARDKEMAGSIKNVLETFFGFEVFVAHDDIQPVTVWEDKIKEELSSTDIVITLLTDNFKQSDFADQECGYALALNKFIIPIKVSLIPYGFLSKIQALPFKIYGNSVDAWIEFCKKIFNIIIENKSFTGRATDLLIKALRNSGSFDTSKKIVKLLNEVGPFTKNQVNDIFKAYLSNGQIHSEAYAVPYFMKKIIKDYKDKIDKNLLLRYEAE